MKQTAILAIDQGTTNTKALLVDAAGNVLARGQPSCAAPLSASGLG